MRMTSVYTQQTPVNLCHAVNSLTNTRVGKVVRFKRKKPAGHSRQLMFAPQRSMREDARPPIAQS